MDYRILPRTQLKVSRLSMGTMTFGSQVSEADSIRMVDMCLEAGINFFDTANIYNGGESERIVGNALKGRRGKVVLASKVRGKMGDAPDDVGLSRRAMRKALEASLKSLQTDYLDLYYLHMPDYDVEIAETLETMAEFVQEGKVRFPAISNYAAWQVMQILLICEKQGYPTPYISQPMYNLLARSIEEEYLPFCMEYQIAVIPYNPLAGGILTGKHESAAPPTSGTRFDGNKMYLDRYWHSDYFQAVREVGVIASDAGITLVELAFRWLLSQSIVDSVILGASRLGQLEANLKACEGKPLDDVTLARCTDVWKQLRGVTPKYNR